MAETLSADLPRDLRLPPRDQRGHKGTFGTVGVIGGSSSEGRRMIGGPCFAALAALRAGAGLVRLATPEPLMNAALTIAPSATGDPIEVDHDGDVVPHEATMVVETMGGECSALAIGPGLGQSPGAQAASIAAATRVGGPVVLDADALNNLAMLRSPAEGLTDRLILTPHPGEFRRLGDALGVTADPIDPATRERAAASLARATGAIVALKGAETVVSDGDRSWTNRTGTQALATAGAGDALTGLIAGLVAQFSTGAEESLDLFDAVRAAVCAHGLAAEFWSLRFHAEAGLLVSELIDLLPVALERLRPTH